MVGLDHALHPIDERGVGDRQRVLVAFAGKVAQFEDRHVGVRPLLAIAVEDLAAQARIAEHHHRLAHLLGAQPARLAVGVVETHRHQRAGDVLDARMGHPTAAGIERRGLDRLGDQVLVRSAHARLLARLAAGDHQSGLDHHLAEHVAALVVRVVPFSCLDQGGALGLLVQLVRRHRLGKRTAVDAVFVEQAHRVRKDRQRNAGPRHDALAMHDEPQPLEILTEQIEGIARVYDHQPRPVHRHRCQAQGVQGRALAGAGRAEHQQMAVGLAVVPVQRIDEERLAAPVPEQEARMTGTARPPEDRQQGGDLRGEHQARAAQVAGVELGVEAAGQCPQQHVAADQLVAWFDQLEARARERAMHAGGTLAQFRVRVAGDQQRQEARIELVAAGHVVEHVLRLGVGVLGFRCPRPARKLDGADALAHRVLGRDDEGDRQHRAHRQAVEAGQLVLGEGALGGEMTDVRALANVLQRERAHRAPAEAPQPGLRIRLGPIEEQGFAEVELRRKILVCRQCEGRKHRLDRIQIVRHRVEEGQQPRPVVEAVHAPRLDAALAQRGHQGDAHQGELVDRALALARNVVALRVAPVEHAAHATHLAAPGLVGDDVVVVEALVATRLRVVLGELLEHRAREFRIGDRAGLR